MGIFMNQKSQFGNVCEGLGMESVGIFYSQWEYFTAIWHLLWTFDTFCGHLVCFFKFWYVLPRQIWQP
jgi:hypothetical protein